MSWAFESNSATADRAMFWLMVMNEPRNRGGGAEGVSPGPFVVLELAGDIFNAVADILEPAVDLFCACL
jgi:hypothetical protein